MFQGFGAAKGRGSESGLAVNAMAALDMAIWDLAGKVQGLPLHTLLGGAVRDSIPAYASSSLFVSSSYERGGTETDWQVKSPDHLLDECRRYVREGFRAVKFGWGNHFAPDDEERLAAIREGLGPGHEAHGRFRVPRLLDPGLERDGRHPRGTDPREATACSSSRSRCRRRTSPATGWSPTP